MRVKSPDRVIEEIDYLEKHYKFRHIIFRDDTFTWNKDWTLEYCNKYRKHFSYPWELFTRADCVDNEIINALKEANCNCIWLGLDSGNENIRNNMLLKNGTNEEFLKLCEDIKKAGIYIIVTNMVGLPYETPEIFEETIGLNRQIYRDKATFALGGGTGPKINVFGPFPGTPLEDVCKKEKWIRPIRKKYKVYRETFLDMPQFPAKKVHKCCRTFRYKVYKDSNPLIAWIYRFRDSRIGEELYFCLPRRFISRVGVWLNQLSQLKQ